MSKPNIVTEVPITMAELKEELKSIRKRDKELNFRAAKTEEYLKQFVQISQKEAEALTKKLEGLNIPRIKDVHIKKMVDILPKSIEEVKVILSAYTVTVNNDNVKKITETIKEFSDKK
jgi:DNA-directed RNA polymerase subunit F